MTAKPQILRVLASGGFKEPLSAAYGEGPSVMFFPGLKCFFPVEISILIDPNKFQWFQKGKSKKKKKKKSSAIPACYATGVL